MKLKKWTLGLTLFVFAGVILLLISKFGIFSEHKIEKIEEPNVILIIIDTLRANHLSSYGYERETTPNIDTFASESYLFKNVISASPWTTPSIGSIFTSQYPAVLGYNDQPVVLDSKFITLAEIFKENNYITRGIIAHNYISTRFGFAQGFDFYDEENVKGHGHISSPSITKKAVSFLKNNKNKKFFLFLHYFDPHYDYILHENYNYYPDYDGSLFSGELVTKLRENAHSFSDNDIDYIKALYDSEISFTDEHIGKLLDELKVLGLYKDALIIITSDHGEEFCERGDHWIGHTMKLYQELIHVPLMIKFPGNNNKKVINESVELIDLMPTIIDYVGFTLSETYKLDGRKINIRKPEKKKIFSETKRFASLQSVIWKGWKLIYDPTNKNKELYNLRKDPFELRNLVSENSKMKKKTETMLQEWNKYLELKKQLLNIEGKQPKLSPKDIEILKSLGYIR